MKMFLFFLSPVFAVVRLWELRTCAMKSWQITGKQMESGCLPSLCFISYEGILFLSKNQTLRELTINSPGLEHKN